MLCAGFSLLQLLLLQNTGFRAQAQYLRCTGLVTPRQVVSSHTGDQTCVPCIGRWILYHWTTKEVPVSGRGPLGPARPRPSHAPTQARHTPRPSLWHSSGIHSAVDTYGGGVFRRPTTQASSQQIPKPRLGRCYRPGKREVVFWVLFFLLSCAWGAPLLPIRGLRSFRTFILPHPFLVGNCYFHLLLLL